MKKKFYSLLQFIWVLLLAFVLSVGNAAVLDELFSYFTQGDTDNLDIPIWLNTGMFFLVVLNAIPLAFAMGDYDARTEINDPIPNDTAVLIKNTETLRCSDVIKKVTKLICVGGAPALLNSAASILLNNPKQEMNVPRYVFATFSGLIAAIGYTNLFGHDITAKENCVQLFKKLPSCKKKIKAVYTTVSVIIGTFADTFLSADIFFHTLGVKDHWRMLSTGCVSVMTTALVSNTEMRSVFLEELEELEPSTNVYLSKLFLIPPSIISGIFAVAGLSKMAEFIAPGLCLTTRAIIFAFFSALILQPNAKAFYFMTLPATDNAIKKTMQSLRSFKKCIYTFFSKEPTERAALLDQPYIARNEAYCNINRLN